MRGNVTEAYTNMGTTFRIRRAQHRAKGEHFKVYKNPRESAVAVGIAVEKKVSWAMDKFLVLAFMAGCYVGIGGTAAVSIASRYEDQGEAKIIFALFYPIGLFLVLFLGGELFTGNLMYYSFALLQGNVRIGSALFALTTTFFINWGGCVASAYLFGVLTEIFEHRRGYIISITIQKVNPSWSALLLRGIPANFLACVAIFTFKSGEDIISKIFAIWVPAMTFLVADFEHGVTNMFLMSLGIFLGAPVSYGKFIYWNLIPVTIGNFIGGGIFVGGLTFYLYSFGENPNSVAVSRVPKGFNFKKWSFLERRKYIIPPDDDDDITDPDRSPFDFRPSLDTGFTYNIHDNRSNNKHRNRNEGTSTNTSSHTSDDVRFDTSSGWGGELRYQNRTSRNDLVEYGSSRIRETYSDRTTHTDQSENSYRSRTERTDSYGSPRRSMRSSRSSGSRRSDGREHRVSFSDTHSRNSEVEYYTSPNRYADARIPIGEEEGVEMGDSSSSGDGSW